jgi:hypothetical protein
MTTTSNVPSHDGARRAEFERVMRYATERAWTDGTEQEVMAALFDILNGEQPVMRCAVARPYPGKGRRDHD